MPQQQITTIPSKSPGDLLTAAEYDVIHDAVNNNSGDLESQLTTYEGQVVTNADRSKVIEDNNPAIASSYATGELPSNLLDGSMAYDKDAETMFYSNGGQFYRMSDNAALSSFTEVDMFIVMGQSNADGKAVFINLDTETGRNLQSLDRTGTLIRASSIDQVSRDYIEAAWANINPGTNAAAVSDRFGPELGFTDTVKAIVDGGGNATYSKPVAILKFAKGATALATNWAAPSGDCYTAMIQDIPNGKFDLGQFGSGYKFNIRGMIWYQGESDAGNITRANDYETNLTNFIADVRNRFNRPTLPIMICKVSYGFSPPAYLDTVRQAQQNVADADANINIIDTDPYPKSDGVHLDETGMYELGEAIAAQFPNIL